MHYTWDGPSYTARVVNNVVVLGGGGAGASAGSGAAVVVAVVVAVVAAVVVVALLGRSSTGREGFIMWLSSYPYPWKEPPRWFSTNSQLNITTIRNDDEEAARDCGRRREYCK